MSDDRKRRDKSKTLRERAEEKVRTHDVPIAQMSEADVVAAATPDGIWDWDLTTGRIWRNEGFAAVYGYAPDEVEPTQDWWRERIHPDDREAVLARVEEVRRDGGNQWSAQYRIRRKDGSHTWVVDRGFILRNEQGQPVRMVGAMTDLTEKLALLNELESKRAELATVLDATTAAIVVVDERGGIRYANAAARKLHGQPLPHGADLESHGPMGLCHLDGTPCAPDELPLVRAALHGEAKNEAELLVKRPDGRTRYILFNTSPLKDHEGRVTGAVAIIHDITERKQVEIRLRENASQLQQQAELLNLAHDSIVVNDMEGRIVFWNRGAEENYGWARDEAVGEISHDLLHTRFPTDLIEITARLLSQGRWNGEVTHTTKSGETIVVSSRWALQRNEDRLPTGILVIDRDITIRKEQEKKIHQHQRELAALTEELLLAEERERRRIALILHDSIGQSLSFSKREIGVLQKKSVESVRRDLESVKEQIDLAIRQTRDLTFELSPTTLHTFGLEAAVEELAEQLAPRGDLQYRFTATEEDKPVSEQIKTLLYRAAREVLTNIIKHADARNVSIHIERVDESVRMTIEDDGKGSDVPRLAQMGHQQDGFGLFSIRERLTYVGGTFAVESRPGEGTKVILTAPLQRTE